jgi:hypothetical protein
MLCVVKSPRPKKLSSSISLTLFGSCNQTDQTPSLAPFDLQPPALHCCILAPSVRAANSSLTKLCPYSRSMTFACSDIPVVDYLALELSGACSWCKAPLLSSTRRPRKYCDDTCRMNSKRHSGRTQIESINTQDRCSHPLLKQFTFADGQTIKMCPDCTTFDTKRRKAMWDKSPWRKAVSGGTGATVNNIGTGPVRMLFKTDTRSVEVVHSPSTKVIGRLPFWKEDLFKREEDERIESTKTDDLKLYQKPSSEFTDRHQKWCRCEECVGPTVLPIRLKRVMVFEWTPRWFWPTAVEPTDNYRMSVSEKMPGMGAV